MFSRSLLVIAPSRFPQVVRELVREGWRVEARRAAVRSAEGMRSEMSIGHRLVRAARRGRLRRRAARTLPRCWPRSSAASDRHARRRHDRAAAGGVAAASARASPARARPNGDHIRFRRVAGRRCSTRCSRRSRRSTWTRRSRGRATSCRPSTGIAPDRRRRDVRRHSCASISARGSAGSRSCSASASAAASPTTWGWARPSWSWRCSHRGCSAGRTAARPSLVVVPRSVVFNWRQEAARFAPELRVLDYSGSSTRRSTRRFAEHDLVLTTYGTLRRDAHAAHGRRRSTTSMLDEAQAIKNAATASAQGRAPAQRPASAGAERHADREPSRRAVEPVRIPQPRAARHRRRPSRARGAAAERDRSDAGRCWRAACGRSSCAAPRRRSRRSCRRAPSRRSHCELERPQRELYDELRDHYRTALLGRIERDGLETGRSMQVLEALLRLRQAACHPGADRRRAAGRAVGQARRAAAAARRSASRKGTRRWCSRSSPACSRCCGPALDARGCPTSISTAHARSAGAGRAVPDRSGVPRCS